MSKIDLARRAEIGRERRARTRAQILRAAAVLLAERPLAAVTVDRVVEAAGVAKGTFYYHFQSMDELAVAVGLELAESFDAVLAPSLGELRDPLARLSLAFERFLDKAIADPAWTRLVVQSAHAPADFGPGIRAHLEVDIVQLIADKRIAVENAHLAADMVMGMWLQIAGGTLERQPAEGLTEQAQAAMLRALGVPEQDMPGTEAESEDASGPDPRPGRVVNRDH
jgi:AcrR family transcriptional regulator